VEEDRRLGVTEPLEVEEVAERVLEEMHPVDEREVEIVPPQHLPEVMTLEELVATLREDSGGLVDGEADLGLGIDADRDRARKREPERLPGADSDLDVGARQQMAVDSIEELHVLPRGISRHPAMVSDPGRRRRGRH
jgi:hypothetical protein